MKYSRYLKNTPSQFLVTRYYYQWISGTGGLQGQLGPLVIYSHISLSLVFLSPQHHTTKVSQAEPTVRLFFFLQCHKAFFFFRFFLWTKSEDSRRPPPSWVWRHQKFCFTFSKVGDDDSVLAGHLVSQHSSCHTFEFYLQSFFFNIPVIGDGTSAMSYSVMRLWVGFVIDSPSHRVLISSRNDPKRTWCP